MRPRGGLATLGTHHGRLDSVRQGIAQKVQQRVGELIDHALVQLDLAARDHHVHRRRQLRSNSRMADPSRLYSHSMGTRRARRI